MQLSSRETHISNNAAHFSRPNGPLFLKIEIGSHGAVDGITLETSPNQELYDDVRLAI